MKNQKVVFQGEEEVPQRRVILRVLMSSQVEAGRVEEEGLREMILVMGEEGN